MDYCMCEKSSEKSTCGIRHNETSLTQKTWNLDYICYWTLFKNIFIFCIPTEILIFFQWIFSQFRSRTSVVLSTEVWFWILPRLNLMVYEKGKSSHLLTCQFVTLSSWRKFFLVSSKLRLVFAHYLVWNRRNMLLAVHLSTIYCCLMMIH